MHNSIIKYKLHHVLFWLLLFASWYFFRYDDYYSNSEALQITALKVVFLAVLVYATNYFLIPKFLYKKNYVLFAFVYVVMIFSASIFKMYLEGILLYGRNSFNVWDNFKERVYDNVIPHFLLVTTGAAFKLLYDYASTQKHLAELTKEKAEAELNFLKSQMNPHFLFNAINSVFFLIDKNNIEARDALHKFSEMLRYQLYECNGQKIAIEKEISFLQDYIQVQRLRLDEDTTLINFKINSSVKAFEIEPLLLLPFVENAFKHLSHYNNGKMNEIKIDISKVNAELLFKVVNTTEGKGNEFTGGIGLNNVKKRLELLYPEKHKLAIYQDKNYFSATLTLNIDH